MKKTIFYMLTVGLMVTSSIVYAATISIESDKQEFKDADSKIYLEGNVKVKSGDVDVTSPRAVVEVDPKNNKVNKVKFEENAYSVLMQSGKKHEIKAQILEMSLLDKVLTADGNTLTTITEQDKPLVIVTADRQEYHKNTNVMKAYGNVNIVYKDVETYSNQAIVDLTKDNDVKQIQLIGNAKLNQKKSKINADKLVFNNLTQNAVATGNVYTNIINEDNKSIEIWSDYQAYDKKENFVTASGSTKIKYEDYLAQGPKVNVFENKATKKLNEAVFLGRSKIESKGRTIEADRISITMNPKDFKAEGNVKSVIPNINN